MRLNFDGIKVPKDMFITRLNDHYLLDLSCLRNWSCWLCRLSCVYQLLEAGYFVRGAARGPKVQLLQRAFAAYQTQFEAVNVPDIASGDFRAVLDGIDAIIHTAAPLPGRADPKTALQSAIDGSLHLLREAVKVGIKRIAVTSSMVSFSPSGPFGSPITKEQAFTGNHWTAYIAEKKFAGLAVMQFADEHPELDITSLSPSWIFGPFIPGFEHLVPKPEFSSFSTNGYIYALLRPDNTFYPSSFGAVDVRDVARAHIAALSSKPATALNSTHKRYTLVSPHVTSYAQALRFIAAERPQLRDRLASAESAPDYTGTRAVEREKLKDVVGITPESYKSWKETVLDAVDSLVALEQVWKDNGFLFNMPTESPL
ncbi:hypothetical protein C8J56DRAFT_1094181 [Mycena floridula]|nr:hypothetical protein C8J56DRAFT_1094181 [Mycena floridula]